MRVNDMFLNTPRSPRYVTFSKTPSLDKLVREWASFHEDIALACDEIISCRPDIVLGRNHNAIIGALGEAAMGQYVYDGIDSATISVPALAQSSRFLIGYEAEPLLAVMIADKDRGIVREYDGIICVDETIAILECKIIGNISNIFRTPHGRQKNDNHMQHMRRNETKLMQLARRFWTIKDTLSNLTGTTDIAMIYFVPHDTYENANAQHSVLQDIERSHHVYVVPFQHDIAAFYQGAKRIQQHAKHARWLRKYGTAYPSLYK